MRASDVEEAVVRIGTLVDGIDTDSLDCGALLGVMSSCSPQAREEVLAYIERIIVEERGQQVYYSGVHDEAAPPLVLVASSFFEPHGVLLLNGRECRLALDLQCLVDETASKILDGFDKMGAEVSVEDVRTMGGFLTRRVTECVAQVLDAPFETQAVDEILEVWRSSPAEQGYLRDYYSRGAGEEVPLSWARADAGEQLKHLLKRDHLVAIDMCFMAHCGIEHVDISLSYFEPIAYDSLFRFDYLGQPILRSHHPELPVLVYSIRDGRTTLDAAEMVEHHFIEVPEIRIDPTSEALDA